jgi:Predicted pyridoxal phosphate-dependent enzyme apparently involved in regulation of cell wall biogenesis
MADKKIFLSSPTMHGEEQIYIKEAFDTNWVAPLGANVDNFEKEMAQYVGVNHAAALVSGTSAIHLAMKLAGVKPNDIVFCSDLTFSATVNPVSYEHAKQVFIDSEYDTWNISPKALEKAFEKYPQCRVVVMVHLYGTPAKIDEIKSICDRNEAVLIEDAAESLSSKYKGKQTGTFGKYGILSFNGNKIITTSGGGMLLSDDEADIKKARFWSTQSRDPAPHYQHSEIGYNYRMSNIVAGIGRGQLIHLDAHRDAKKVIYEMYRTELRNLPIKMNPYESCSEPNFWLSCMTIEDSNVTPEKIRLALDKHNIECRPIWKPMHQQPVFAECDFVSIGDKVVGDDIFNRGLCLPSDIKMTADEQSKVIEIIKSCF